MLGIGAIGLYGCSASARDSTEARVARGKLRWAPPALSDPETIDLGDGYSNTKLEPTQDAILRLPDGVKHGAVTIEGGNDIVLIGGAIKIPPGTPPGVANNRFRIGLYIKGTTGTVHAEGLSFSAAPGVEWDAIDINAPQATVQLENIRAERLRGGYDGLHADVIQPWGGVRVLRVDRLSASSNYQGLMIPIDRGPIGRAVLSRIDLRGLSADAVEGGHLLWLTSGTRTCAGYPVQLRDFYIEPRPGVPFGKSVWPQWRRPAGCNARARHGVITWPGLTSVNGGVRAGSPPRGEYVPPGVAGSAYASPGYHRQG